MSPRRVHQARTTTADDDAGDRPPGPRRGILLGLLLVTVTFAAYLPALQAGFIWDDDQYVTENPHLLDGAGLGRIWIPRETPQYYPLTFTTFWLEHKLWAFRPAGYHAVNVALHALCAVLVWRLARRLRLPGAWMIAAVFALHPVHVESVAWITERKNVLSGALFLGAALAYLRFEDAREDAATGAGPVGSGTKYAVALALFVGAMLAKTVAAALPVVLLLLLLYRRCSLDRRTLLPLVPFFAVGLVLGLHTAWLEQVHVGARGADFDFTIVERVLIASRAALFYPQKILLPIDLVFIYPRWEIGAGSIAWYTAPAIIALAAAGALVAWRRGYRGPAVAGGIYLACIFPALGFIDVYPMLFSFVADHFQYLASLGVIAFVVAGAARLLRGARIGVVLGAVMLTALGTLTWFQGYMYQGYEEGRLWEWTLRVNPDSWLARMNFGVALARQGHLDLAEPHLERAVAQRPEESIVQANLGHLRLLQGRSEEAMARYEAAYALDPESAMLIARALLEHGDRDGAAAWSRRALRAMPGSE